MRQNIFAWLIGILVVAMLAAYIDVSNTIGIGTFSRDVPSKLGLDLQGGLQVVLQATGQNGQRPTSQQLTTARTIIEDRANSTGASEPVVQTAEGDRILVELPGVQDPKRAEEIVKETAFLEIVDGGTTPLPEGTLICTNLGCPRSEQTAAGASSSITGTSSITSTTSVTATKTTTGTAATTTPQYPTFQTIVKGDELDGSKAQVVFNSAGQPEVQFAIKGDAASRFADFTTSHVNQYMPIVLDKKVISSPQIQSPITGGSGVINHIGLQAAQDLAIKLKFGALPVSLDVLSTHKISATLGQDAINKSIIAGVIGLSLVVIFMIVYYRLPGVLASVALLIYALAAYAIFKLVPVTLTLAGIAGFILSIGMAVDANVLIFSRLKEELRSGKTLGAAVEAGFDHAWPSIRDSNVSTLITCAILFWFGSTFGGASIIKGFALTLAIGVIISLFTAISVTRTFLRAIVNTSFGKNRWAFDLDVARPTSAATPTTTTTNTPVAGA